MRRFALFALAGCLASLAQVAHAQCAEGREVSAATAGRCCWPGQRWNNPAARCEGPPRCPPGLFAEGDTCVAPAQTSSGFVGSPPAEYAPSGSLASPTSPTHATAYAPSAAPAPRAQPQEPQVISTSIEKLVIAGGVIASIAYGFSIVVGILYEFTSGYYWRPGEPWTAFIPLAGGFIWAGTDTGCCMFPPGQVFGSIGSGLQSLGLLFMVIGALARETTVVGPRPWGASLEPELVGGPGEAGLGLRWRF